MNSLLKLKKLWEFEIDRDNPIQGLAFSDNGLLEVVPFLGHECIYILDKNGNVVDKNCDFLNDRSSISFCCGKFGIVGISRFVLIYDILTRTWKKIYIEDDYALDLNIITMLKDGFLTSVGGYLTYFDFQGHIKWSIYMPDIKGNPAVYKGYVYVPRLVGRDFDLNVLIYGIIILKLSDRSKVRTIEFNEGVWNVRICKHHLAVGTAHHIYLYDISDPTNPRELWNYDGIARSCRIESCWGAHSVAFGPGCKYLVSVDVDDKKIHIFDINGKQVLEREFRAVPQVVDWWKDRIAVGLNNGKVYVYKVSSAFPITNKKKITVRDLLFGSKEEDQFEVE